MLTRSERLKNQQSCPTISNLIHSDVFWQHRFDGLYSLCFRQGCEHLSQVGARAQRAGSEYNILKLLERIVIRPRFPSASANHWVNAGYMT